MKCYGVTIPQLEAIAYDLDMRIYNARPDGNHVKFQLRPTSTDDLNYRKTGHNGRRINAISWEGHKAYFDVLFDRYPTAKIVSGLVPNRSPSGNLTGWGITYDGRDDYEANYMRTA